MKYILAVLLAGVASGVSASDLPDCVGDEPRSWNNCVGTQTFANGSKRVGEWKDNEFNGLEIAGNTPNTDRMRPDRKTNYPSVGGVNNLRCRATSLVGPELGVEGC